MHIYSHISWMCVHKVNSILLYSCNTWQYFEEKYFLCRLKLAGSSYTWFTDLALLQEIWFPGFCLIATKSTDILTGQSEMCHSAWWLVWCKSIKTSIATQNRSYWISFKKQSQQREGLQLWGGKQESTRGTSSTVWSLIIFTAGSGPALPISP